MNNIIFGCKVIGGACIRMFRFSKHFGWNVAWNLFCNDVRKYFSHSKSGREKANAKHHEVIENYLCAKGYGVGLSCSVSSNHVTLTENVGDNNIWVCWWQGKKSMPEMVKKCFNSIIRYSNGHPVKLITFDNYKDYVQVDYRIVDKLKNGTFKLAHFADLVRLKLLERYGGLWLDSTILLTANINEDFFQKFFSVKIRPVDNDSVSEYRWCSFVLGGGKNIRYIYSQLSCMLERYMLENNLFIDYLLIDYFLDILYRQDKSVKETIDTMPFTNPNLHKLRLLFDNEFDETIWKTIVSNTNIFKLTYKGVHSRYTKSGIPTFYGHILCTEIP